MSDLVTQLGYQCWVLGPTGYHFDRDMFAKMIVEECIKLNGQELSMAAHSRMLGIYYDHFGIK